MLQEAGYIKNTVFLICWHIQCLHLVNSEVAWLLISLGIQVQLQIILNPDYLPDYLSVSYDYVIIEVFKTGNKINPEFMRDNFNRNLQLTA